MICDGEWNQLTLFLRCPPYCVIPDMEGPRYCFKYNFLFIAKIYEVACQAFSTIMCPTCLEIAPSSCMRDLDSRGKNLLVDELMGQAKHLFVKGMKLVLVAPA